MHSFSGASFSPQPMHGWTVQHAVRELWQNLRDGAAAAFGPGPLEMTFSASRCTLERLLQDAEDRLEGGEEAEERYDDGEEEDREGDEFAVPLLGRIELSCGGIRVGSINASAANTLIFTQRFAALQPRHLLLASSKSGAAAGAHGEGFKVAINLLLTRGFGVTYTMDGQRWRFVHAPLHSEDVLTMVVEMTRTPVASPDLVIEVTGTRAGALFRLEQDWEVIHAALAVSQDELAASTTLSPVALPSAALLSAALSSAAPSSAAPPSAVPPAAAPASATSLSDVFPSAAPMSTTLPLVLRSNADCVCVLPQLAGRVYCRNLYVNFDEAGLACLGLTVNLDCQLQRDRHALPPRLPSVIGRVLGALALLPAQASSYKALCEHLLAAFRAHPEELCDYAPRLRELLRAHAAAQAGCEAREVVFLSGAERPGEGLSGLGLTLVPHAGDLADRSSERDILLERVSRLGDWVPSPGSRQAVRLGWLNALLDAVAGLGGWSRFPLCVKADPVSGSGGRPCAPYVRLAFKDPTRCCCYMSCQLLEKPTGWRDAAQYLAMELVSCVVPSDCTALLTQHICTFLSNPVTFTAAGWRSVTHGEEEEPVRSNPPAAGPVGPTLMSTQSHGVGHGDASVHIPPCGGAMLQFPGAPPPDGDFMEPPPPCSCIPPLSRLLAHSVPGDGSDGSARMLYVDAAVLLEAEVAGGPLETVKAALPGLLLRFDAIVHRWGGGRRGGG